MILRRPLRAPLWLVLAAALSAWPLAAPARAAEQPGIAPGAPTVGDVAPNFEIQGFDPASFLGKRNLLLVFYRGHF